MQPLSRRMILIISESDFGYYQNYTSDNIRNALVSDDIYFSAETTNKKLFKGIAWRIKLRGRSWQELQNSPQKQSVNRMWPKQQSRPDRCPCRSPTSDTRLNQPSGPSAQCERRSLSRLLPVIPLRDFSCPVKQIGEVSRKEAVPYERRIMLLTGIIHSSNLHSEDAVEESL